MSTLVERTAANLLKHRRACKRCPGHEVGSLSVLVPDPEGGQVPLATQIGPQHREGLSGRYTDSEDRLADLAMDIPAVLDALPEELRDICRRLQKRSITEVARDLGIPRTTLQNRIGEIARAFAIVGPDKI